MKHEITPAEAIEVLQDDLRLWGRILGKFEKNSLWFKEGEEKIRAYRLAIEYLRKEDGNDG